MKASDLIKQLEGNSSYNETQRLKEEETKKKVSEIMIIQAPFIEALHKNGFKGITRAGDLLSLKKVNSKLATLLLEWIPKISNTHDSKEMLVRALAKADKPFDGKLLTDLFDDKDNSATFKWAVANTIASATVENIEEWLENKLNSTEQPKENEMLVYAAIKYFPYEYASVLLERLFNTFPLQVADAFTYIGKKSNLEFLEKSNKALKKEVKSRVDKAIKKLKAKI